MKSDGEKPPTIRIAAAMLVGADNRLLLVRKRGTYAFMQPGGKIKLNEAPVIALVREIHEELGIIISLGSPTYLGSFSAPAANEPGSMVDVEVFRVVVTADVKPAAEIEEIVWIEAASAPDIVIAPLTRDHILPLRWSTPAK